MLQSTAIPAAGRQAANPLPAWILTATLRLPWGRAGRPVVRLR